MPSVDVVSTLNQQSLYGSSKSAPQSGQKLGKSEFMSLLITQLRHQNPLEPMDNEDFIAQLSQFSSLEQLEGMRQSVDESVVLQRSLGQSMAVGLLGKQVTIPGESISLGSSGSAVLGYTLDEGADVRIEIKNVQGAVVRTLAPGAQPMGNQKVIWDGKDDRGNALPEGNYTYHVLAVGGGDRQVSVSPFFEGRVDSVRFSDDGILLTIGGIEVPISKVRMIQ
ncbi:hypothetical protein FJZ36_12150 [Candidatus Poribacteria bacterium]|nr:hypothetical protein [Candidatus Poribacteria bacterium]